LAVSLWGVDSREISGLLEVREGEALDASLDGVDYRLGRSLAEYRSLLRVAMADDVVLRLARGQDCEAKAERAERLQAASALLDNDILSGRQQAEAAGEVGDGQADAPRGGSEGTSQQVRVTHYFCLNPWGEGGYCGRMGCPPYEQVGAGYVACSSARCGDSVQIGEVVFRCGDTGSRPIEAEEVIDVACYGDDNGDAFFHWGPPGTPEYEQPCPTFADYETLRWLP
jgi:hypothetical protein